MFFLGLSFWAFWTFFGVFLAALLICEIFESGGGALFTLLAAIILLHFIGDTNLLQFFGAHYGEILWWVAGYVVLGIPWAVFKWYLLCVDARDDYLERRAEYVREAIKSDKASLADATVRWERTHKATPPKVVDNKARLTRWMACWVTSVLWTLLDDFLTRFYRRIVQALQGLLQRISDNVWKGV